MFALLLACSGPELPAPAPEKPTSSFHAGGAGAPLRLGDALANAVITLPEGNRPASAVLGQTPLNHWRKDGLTWVHDYPMRLTKKERKKRFKSAPHGTALLFNGVPLEYGGKGWRLEEGRIISSVEPQQAALSSQALERVEQRLEQGRQEPAEWARHEVSIETADIGQLTVPGLLIPAPGSISWTVDVPEGAELKLSAVIAPKGFAEEPGDGAHLIVRLDEDEVARLDVGHELEHHTIDLSAHAGRTVGLVLESADEDTEWDHVFVGEPLLYSAPAAPPRRVVVIGLDTLRYDGLSQHGYARDVSAALDDFAASCVLFDNAYAPAPRTRPSFRTSTTGHYPMSAITAATIGEVFREAGFTTAGITANVHLVPKHGFNDGFDFWQFHNGRDADVQFERARTWLDANAERDSLLFLHLMDAHNFYKAPGLWKNKYVEHEPGPLDADMNRWEILRLDGIQPENERWLRDRYDGEVAFMTNELAGFLAYLLDLPGETLIVIHSDHGEEFWDHGSYEHNHTLYDEVVKANLWIRTPQGWGGGPHRVDAPVGLHDIAPTIYDLAGIDAPTTDGRSLRPFLDASQPATTLAADLEARPLQLGHLMYDQEQWGAIVDGHKCILRTHDGAMAIFDLDADPKELTNLEANADLKARCVAGIGEAAGFPAGDGLRVRVKERSEFTLVFDSPVLAEVMDPDAASHRRSNIEWGDLPERWPEDVGTVALSEDRLRVTFTPGTYGKGTVMVVSATDPVTIEGDASALELERGPVLLIQDSVRDRLAEDARTDLAAAHDPAAIEALERLGYLEEH